MGICVNIGFSFAEYLLKKAAQCQNVLTTIRSAISIQASSAMRPMPGTEVGLPDG
jgi:hypothetical protein